MSCVPLTNVVASAVLPSDTVTPLRKLVPVTVRVNAAPPDTTLDGAMLVIVGVGAVIVRVTEFDAGPDALASVIDTDPGCAIMPAGTPAVTCVPLTKLVTSGVLLNETVAPATNPVPFTVSVNVGPAAATLAGEILVMTGGSAPIVNTTWLERTAPFSTETLAVPCCAIRLAVTAAVNCVPLT